MSKQKTIVMYFLVWKYFDYPAEKKVRRERAGIYSGRRFNIFIWETMLRDVRIK